jgi:hypothetical protein
LYFIGFVCNFINFLCEFPVKTTEHTVASYDSTDFTWKFLTVNYKMFALSDAFLINLEIQDWFFPYFLKKKMLTIVYLCQQIHFMSLCFTIYIALKMYIFLFFTKFNAISVYLFTMCNIRCTLSAIKMREIKKNCYKC